MNLLPRQTMIASYLFRFLLIMRWIVPRRKCHAFGNKKKKDHQQIEKIYVINLDRAQSRWLNMKQELSRILDINGIALLNLTERSIAIDANKFIEDPSKDDRLDPFYTLSDQLLVEPQPLTLPTRLELDSPIRMSRAECAIAQSHINVWEKVASGNHDFALILEDDVWFHSGFAKSLDNVWNEAVSNDGSEEKFDILYLSYLEVKHGAPKTILSKHLFRPARGLWHLSGYILSKVGAKKLICQLPCRGPIDLWINLKFESLKVRASKESLISQRRDIVSSNSYSVLPSLTKIGAITSEGASLFNIRPSEHPVFAFGSKESGLSSLAMALSMLGYKCCSDLKDIPVSEMRRLLKGRDDRIFNAYVNIGSLDNRVRELYFLYPNAKFIITVSKETKSDPAFLMLKDKLEGANLVILHGEELNKWKTICEHLRCAPPRSSYPLIDDIGQRHILDKNIEVKRVLESKHDSSPWIAESNGWWNGINVEAKEEVLKDGQKKVNIIDTLEFLDTKLWMTRSDTFTDNLALFRPSNVKFSPEFGAMLSIKAESLGVRDYSSGSICSQDQYLFGKFEATMQASRVPGVITGFFLYRNLPRQEVDIEIAGNLPNRLLVNVFFNPGNEGANYDYGYRGTPTYIDLGFDASESSHRYTIEWNPNEIRWLVDGNLVYRRGVWDPTPIPHLPMILHANNWVTRSTQLAGRIKKQNLPTASIFKEIRIEATLVIKTQNNTDSNKS